MRKRHDGAQLVEFALVGGLFFALFLGTLTIGYWFHLLDTLTEGVRRGARVAAVCPKFSPNIYLTTVFASTSTSSTQYGAQTWPATTHSPVLPQLTTDMVTVAYTPDVGGVSEALGGFYDTVRTVTVTIGDPGHVYQFTVNLPILGRLGSLPRVAVTMPVESMGRTSLDTDNPARTCLMP